MILSTANNRKSRCILLDILLDDKTQTCATCFGPAWPVLVQKYYAVFPVETNVWMCNGGRVLFWQSDEDCLDCAACCGPAFDAVEVSVRDPVRKKYPQLIKRKDGRLCVPRREGNFCSQLGKGNRCAIYS